MTCNVCGYTGNDFTCNGMGRLCCPRCGAEQPEVKVPAVLSEDDYAEQLRKARQEAIADLERRKQDAEYANQSQMEAEAKHRQEAEAKRRKKEKAKKTQNRRERLFACLVPVGIIILTIFILRDPGASQGFGFAAFVIITACIGAIMGALLKQK